MENLVTTVELASLAGLNSPSALSPKIAAARAQRVECPDCGQMIRSKGSKLHTQGVYHKQSKRIRRLLREPCMSFQKIADRLGVSGERVRQLAKTCEGLTGKDRRPVCVLNKREKDAEQHSLLKELRPICEKHELTVEPIYHRRGLFSTRVIINGHSCLKVALCPSLCAFTRSDGHHNEYVCFRCPQNETQAEFAIGCFRGTWFVFPRAVWPRRQTMFSFDPQRSGTKKTRHDWVSYKEAWHLLKKD